MPAPTAHLAPDSGARPTAPSVGILSTFPPTACGIATFSAALAAGLEAGGSRVDVVRCGRGPAREDGLVVDRLGTDPTSAIRALERSDVAIVQHEYGIYDGEDGDAVLGVLDRLAVPAVLVAHTVLQSPTPGQRRVLEEACAAAGAVVVMTETARTRMLAGYAVPEGKVTVVPHGAATPPHDRARTGVRGRSPLVLTWGLLGPGKGIEWAIDAIAELRHLQPEPTYLVAGATHPKVAEAQGEAYREMLVARAARTGAAPLVRFDDAYRDLTSLTELIRSADVVVLPYDSKDQVTSGVLVDAVAAGRPVVATAFPHAVELLASGAGTVVPQRDPGALAAAIEEVLVDHRKAASMAAEARRLAPSLSWAAVAARYARLGADLVASRTGAAA